MVFKIRGEDRVLRIAATGVDAAGHNTAAVLAYCNARGAGRVFATVGRDGPIPLWPHRGSLSKIRKRESFFVIGVSSGKELIVARLAMTPPLPGFRKAGHIHFSIGLDAEFYAQLNSERQVRKVVNGREVSKWEKVRERNEAFDLLVGALCVRRYFGRIVGGSDLTIPAAERSSYPPIPVGPTTVSRVALQAPTTVSPNAPPDEQSLRRIKDMIAKNPDLLKNEHAQALLQEVKKAGYDIKTPTLIKEVIK
jgi:phage terminase large subunit GpA-like protein